MLLPSTVPPSELTFFKTFPIKVLCVFHVSQHKTHFLQIVVSQQTNERTPWNWTLLEGPPVVWPIVSQHPTEPKGSLPHLQELHTCPYLNQTNPVHTAPFCLSSIRLNIITHRHLGIASGYFLPGFLANNLYAFFLSPMC
jgi:hypothetical protein